MLPYIRWIKLFNKYCVSNCTTWSANKNNLCVRFFSDDFRAFFNSLLLALSLSIPQLGVRGFMFSLMTLHSRYTRDLPLLVAIIWERAWSNLALKPDGTVKFSVAGAPASVVAECGTMHAGNDFRLTDPRVKTDRREQSTPWVTRTSFCLLRLLSPSCKAIVL